MPIPHSRKSSYNSGAVPAVAYGITSTNALIRFDTATPGTISSTPITGTVVGDAIVGIDFRPATGQLFGLGSGSRLYTINPTTAIATQVGVDGQFTLPPGLAFGFDFNPTVDRIRITSDLEQNFRLNPNDGTRPGGVDDTTLTFPGASSNFDAGGAAYTNNFAGATTTTLFDIDTNRNTLVRQGGANFPPGTPPVSPNSGQLFTVGPLGFDPTDFPNNANLGFDIQTLANGTNVAFAAITTNGTTSALYTINLSTGAATQIGATPIGGIAPLLVRALAVAPAGDFEFSAPTYSVGESGPVATITVNRLRGSEGIVSVTASTSNGTATTPGDYTSTSQTLVFFPGITSQTFTFPINNDTLDEPDETVNLALSNPTGNARLGAQSTAVLTITDNDPPPTVSLSVAGSPLVEAGGVATVTATLSAASGQNVTVTLGFTGTATNLSDYTRSATSIVIPSGSLAGSVTITSIADALDEPDETVIVDITGVTNATASAAQQITATIVDAPFVFLDLNANGATDPGERRLAGRTVFRDSNNNGQLDPGEPTATTGSDGTFTLSGTGTARQLLAPGEFTTGADGMGTRITSSVAAIPPCNTVAVAC